MLKPEYSGDENENGCAKATLLVLAKLPHIDWRTYRGKKKKKSQSYFSFKTETLQSRGEVKGCSQKHVLGKTHDKHV